MFREVKLEEAVLDPILLFRDNWGLITAGKPDNFNTMTVSWGSFGQLWGRAVATLYVRQDRYTYEYTEKDDHFTLAFFDDAYHGILEKLGRTSGRDMDKMHDSGLASVPAGEGVSFEEAWLTVVCKKIYAHTFEKGEFCDPTVDEAIYKNAPYHKMYIGEIEKVLVRE